MLKTDFFDSLNESVKRFETVQSGPMLNSRTGTFYENEIKKEP